MNHVTGSQCFRPSGPPHVICGVIAATSLLSAALLQAQPRIPVNVSSASGRVRPLIDPDTGTIRCTFHRADGSIRDTLILPPVRLDGVPQGLNSGKPASSAGGSRDDQDHPLLQISFESLGPASAAIVWSMRDGRPRDFDVALEDNSAYYGCGERFGSLNHKGHILPMASIDRPEEKGDISYKPVPFYMSTRGYAVWLDSPAPGAFDLNATDRERVTLRFRAGRLRLVLIDGPDFAAMLAEFTRQIGRPRVPPAWAFAPWKSRNIHANRDEVLADAELTRRHDLPGSVIVIDSPWETGYNDFILNERQFAAPEAMFARLRELGFEICLWLTPFINVENLQDMQGIDAGPSRNYAEAARQGFLVRGPDGSAMLTAWWKGRGGLVDFTNPAAVRWWHGQLDRTRRWGARALKCDDGEGNFVQDARFHDGTPAAEMKNRYALLYLQAAQQYLDDRLKGDGVLFARCGFSGTQRFPFCWAGDNEASWSFENGLPSVILAGQNAALSGFSFWSHDVGGYIGTQTPELFIRWSQFGAFSPLMQVHMTSNLGPWDFGDQALAIYRRFAALHTALYPYRLDAAHEAAQCGMPIIRPMVLAFPGDPAAWSHRYQYLYGPDLLVAPIYQPGTRRSVYLPRNPDHAEWYDYWSGARYSGGELIEIDAPLERIPLFVRGGAIIPMLPPGVDTLVARHAAMASDVIAMDERRQLQIWPGPQRSIRTAEGIEVRTSQCGGKQSIALRSQKERRLELIRCGGMEGGPILDSAAHGVKEPAIDREFMPVGDRMSVGVGPVEKTVAWPGG